MNYFFKLPKNIKRATILPILLLPEYCFQRNVYVSVCLVKPSLVVLVKVRVRGWEMHCVNECSQISQQCSTITE